MGGADCGQFTFPNARHFRPVLEETGGHRAWLVQVEIDADAVPPGPLYENPEIRESLLVIFSEFWERSSARRQVAQNALQPDAVDPHRGESLEQSVRIRIQVRVQQGIAIDGNIGIHQPLLRILARRGSNRPVKPGITWQRRGELAHEVETGHTGPADLGAKIGLDPPANPGRSKLRGIIGCPVAERLTTRFHPAEFDPEKVFFAQCETESLRRPLQELE